jgi:prevent-host-death family protein
MRRFTTVELLRDLKTVTHAAAREPIAITQHRKPRFVLMAIEDFEKLQNANPDPRMAYYTSETPPKLKAMLLKELDRIAEGRDTSDDG